MSDQTCLSLLQRLKLSSAPEDWHRFTEMYQPMLRSWLRRSEIVSHDSDDLIQSVLMVVVRRLSDFDHNGNLGAFRSWLRTITCHCLKDHWRSKKGLNQGIGGSEVQERIAQLEDPQSQLSQMWNEEHDRHVMRQLLEQLKQEFEAKTWKAFQMFALESRPVNEVARELEMTTNAVFIAKSRVVARLRHESQGLLDDM
jgi:RNA polymerase sigma factor (sigma-70 family)